MDGKLTHKRAPGRSAPARRIAGLTLTQIMILVLVAVAGTGSLIWAALVLLAPGPGPSPAILAQASIPGASAPPEQAGLPQSRDSEPPAPSLPVSCAKLDSDIRLASSARIVDSRTLEVISSGETLRIGLAGITLAEDPERSSQVIEIASDYALYPPLLLVGDIAEQDAEGRLLRYVFSGDRFLNLDLVRLGLAQADLAVPDRVCLPLLQQAEQQARAERIGMWQPAAVPTATFMPFVTLDASRQAPCDCISRPICSDFRTRAAAQACYNACNDYNSKLDWDRDGLACEELP